MVARVTDVSFTLDDGTGKVDCRRWYAEIFQKEIVLRSLEHVISPNGMFKFNYCFHPSCVV